MPITFRAARAEDAGTLSELALRSKAHWGYDQRFLAACRDDLTLRPEEISARRAAVAQEAGRVVGFYTLDGTPPAGELGNLWIDPAWLRRGIGRLLWHHAADAARRLGFQHLLIASDPHAEGFYSAMGATRTGTVASTVVPGRLLPLLRFELPR